jgi:predicted nucleotidyltransferase
MVIQKHSYILTKDFILCCLSEDNKYFYGEILYGKKALKNVKIMHINGKKYYKYWELESMIKKHQTIIGEKTNYEKYIKSTKRLYPKNYYLHKLIGKLFRISKDERIKVLVPKKYSKLNQYQKKIINHLCVKFSVPYNCLLIGGSTLFSGKTNFPDFDVIINGKKEGIKTSKSLTKITKSKKNKILIGIKKYHPRRFRLENVIICPFAIHKEDNFFEVAKIKTIEKPKKDIAKVVDCSESLFSPAVYKIKNNENNIYHFISYFVGHNHLFRKNDIIEFKAPLYEFKIRNIKKRAYVIPIQGSWIDIKRKIKVYE